jgi:beta-galactosidase/beta-glucuronidase
LKKIIPVFFLLGCFAILAGALSAAHAAPSKVLIKKFNNGHYQLMVNGQKYLVKGVCYSPIPIGSNHEYDWWASPYKPWLSNGKLMKEMGINTIRIYQAGENIENVRTVVRELYNKYGIRTILGHWLGFWEYPCPFYGNEEFQKKVTGEVLAMVQALKDEPGVLMWILGNENNYSCIGTVNPWSCPEIDQEPDPQKQKYMRAKIYYSYVNGIAKQVKAIDPHHPVALGNGELIGLDVASGVCPDIDLVACIIYRGKTFGNLFNSLKLTFDRPLLLSEFGADAYNAATQKEDQGMQAYFLESLWHQIYQNIANAKGAGNCIGGTMFEWTDEWWKHNENDRSGWSLHDTESFWSNGSYYFDAQAQGNKNMNEEWFGIVALSADLKEAGLDRRIPRKAYYVIKELWKNPPQKVKGKKIR